MDIIINDNYSSKQIKIGLLKNNTSQFSGSIGLLYNEGINIWTREDIKNLIVKWIKMRDYTYDTNLFINLSNIETSLYIYDGEIIEKPIIRIYGEIKNNISSDKMKETLINFFTYLKIELKQYYCNFNYNNLGEYISIKLF
jgi:hypothetical protein